MAVNGLELILYLKNYYTQSVRPCREKEVIGEIIK